MGVQVIAGGAGEATATGTGTVGVSGTTRAAGGLVDANTGTTDVQGMIGEARGLTTPSEYCMQVMSTGASTVTADVTKAVEYAKGLRATRDG